MCVVFEDYDGKLPSTVTELYDNIVFSITNRYCEKYGLSMEDNRLERSKEILGRLAYKGLLKDTLYFCESDLNDDCTRKIHCTEMGFLYKERSKRKIKQDHTYWFLPKTFQEYLSAFYLTEKVKRQETVGNMIDELKDTERFMQVLKFISGILHKKDAVHLKAVLEELGTVLLKNKDEESVLDILCEVLSESPVDKDMAGIIHQFLPEILQFHPRGNGYPCYEYAIRMLPRILNLLCTKDGVNNEVYIDYFCFSEFEISTSDIRLICEVLMEKLKVRKLQFIANTAVDEEEQFPFYIYIFTGEPTKILAKALRQNSNLKELHLKFISLPDVGAIIAALALDTLSTDMAAGRRGSVLHTLALRANKGDEQSAFAAAKMLRTNNTLKSLEMSLNPLASKGVTSIAEALKSSRTLNHLDLRNTDCGNEGVAALADMLRSNETLTELLISNVVRHYTCVYEATHNKLGKDGAVALADALRVNNSLKELHLCNNDITDEGFRCLA